MFRQAQHDRERNESAVNRPIRAVFVFYARRLTFFLSFRAKPGNLVETNSFFFPAAGFYFCLSIAPRGLSSAAIFVTLPRDVSTALRLLNMTRHTPLSFRAEPRNLVETKRSACFLFLLSPKLRGRFP